MSKIEWTDQTWNPIVGCTVTSPGCKNCYAMKMAWRLANNPKTPHYAGTVHKVNGKPVWTGRINAAPDDTWAEPLRRQKPTRYFVNSMGDLFHPNVPDDLIDRAFAVMALAPHNIFQVLTKHPDRMRKYLSRGQTLTDCIIEDWVTDMMDCSFPLSVQTTGARLCEANIGANYSSILPLSNVWLGTSVEDQPRADNRRADMAALSDQGWTTFVSYEPALGPVDWTGWEFLNWMICGGESGPNARPIHPDWVRDTRDWCLGASVFFFFKQWGAWAETDMPNPPPMPTNVRPLNQKGHGGYFGGRTIWVKRVGKKAAGRLLDGREHNDMPPVMGGGHV